MNTLRVGATRKGKSKAAARDALDEQGTVIILDPHKDSLARDVLMHARGNVLYECLSDPRPGHSLGWDFLSPSTHPDAAVRQMENDQRTHAFVELATWRRNTDSLVSTPLCEEWTLAVIQLYLAQPKRSPLTILPFGFMPGSDGFELLLEGNPNSEVVWKFDQLRKLTPRGLRAEVGSASRLINGVCRSPSFANRSRGGFRFEEFLDTGGALVVERGDGVSEDAMRTMMGAIVMKTIEYAKTRKRPTPPIRIVIDEANNAGLIRNHESKALAETQKYGLSLDILVQTPDFPREIYENVMQNCLRKEWFGCASVEVARTAAQDIVGASYSSDQSHAGRIQSLTSEFMNMKPGWRWVRDPLGVRKEYVPLLEDAWAWPRLQQAKLQEKINRIYARPEYGMSGTDDLSHLLKNTRQQQSSSRTQTPDSSPAERWKRGTSRRSGD